MKIIRRANIITGALFTASAAILLGVVYFAFNIQVIKDWNLTLPSGDIHAGDSVIVVSTYTKIRQVTGVSTRTIECQVLKGIYLSTPLNRVSANRAPSLSSTGTGVLVDIPTSIKAITHLPDTCHICIALSYPVLPLRTVPYFKCTNDFQLLPQATTPAVVSSSPTQTSQAQVQTVRSQPVVISSSPSQSTAPATSQQSNNLQPAAPMQSQPNILQSLLMPITKLIGGL